jgi:hypothetical protein
VSFDPIPQARIVRQAGQRMALPPAPRTEDPGGAGYLRTALAYAIGLWPLTCVVLLMAGLLVVTVQLGAP